MLLIQLMLKLHNPACGHLRSVKGLGLQPRPCSNACITSLPSCRSCVQHLLAILAILSMAMTHRVPSRMQVVRHCKMCQTYLTLNMELGLNTPHPMGVSAPSVTRTVSPAFGWGLPTTLSTAPLYTMGWPLRKSAVLPLFSTTLGTPVQSSVKVEVRR